MTGNVEPKAKIGLWPLLFCLFLDLPLLLAVPGETLIKVPASAQSMGIFQFLAEVSFFCFLFGIPMAVLSALFSGVYLRFRFRRLSDGFRLCFACNCVFAIILVYAAAGVLSGLSR